MNKEILVIGSLNMDQVIFTPRHPAIGETILGTSYATHPGGKGANQAVAAARLGAHVTMIGCVGEDQFGAALIKNLAANGVNTDYMLRTSSSPSGTALITVDGKGRNSIIVLPGANHQLTPANLDDNQKCFSRANLVLLQLEIPLPVVEHAIDLARKYGLRVILNPAPAHDLTTRIYSQIDTLIPNEVELAQITRLPSNTLDELREAGAMLRLNGLKNLLVTRGGQGVFYQGFDREIVKPAFPVTPVDTTAAGDAFIGGFAAALSNGQQVSEAIRIGSAAGALATTRTGAQTSLPTLAEIQTFLLSRSTQ